MMLLSDNETDFDLINNDAIASTITALIKEDNDQPLSIGVHGDWGAGKSSILKMIQKDLESEKSIKCIQFNGWRYQGFEDAKIALLKEIVLALENDKRFSSKVKDKFADIWRNINLLSAAKILGGITFSALGLGPLTPFSNKLIEKVSANVDDSDTDIVSNNVLDSLFPRDSSGFKEFIDFQEKFSKLLDEVKIKKLVILIDDLDRCLPNVIIETLEAMRLFLFLPRTAFVIAADETMIKYAVREHFPNVTKLNGEDDLSTGYGYADKYLEKLIQVPFRLPVLGRVEAGIYIMLLLIGAELMGKNSYQNLVKEAKTRMKQPWNFSAFTQNQLRKILGTQDFESIKAQFQIAMAITPVLALHTNGNPRKIKRFINMMMLRRQIADARGYGELISFPVLAKMMLAENYYPLFYKTLANHLDQNGKCEELKVKSNSPHLGDNKENNGKEVQKKGKEPIKNEKVAWIADTVRKVWIPMEPYLNNIDLRPYFFLSKERVDYLSGYSNDMVREAANLLFKNTIFIINQKDLISSLSDSESLQVFSVVSNKILSNGENFVKIPDGMEGLKFLVEQKPQLIPDFVTFLTSLPTSNLGSWIATGWDKAVPKNHPERQKLDRFIKYVSEANPLLKAFLHE